MLVNVTALFLVYTQHLVQTVCAVDNAPWQKVVVALDFGGHLGELLVEGIWDVVCWICGYDENALSHRR